MGKKKIALVDLSRSEKAQLKATGVRSQKVTIKPKQAPVETPAAEPIQDPILKESTEGAKIEKGPELKVKKHVKHGRSQRYLAAKAKVKNQAYPPAEAIKLLRGVSLAKFDPSVELHLNLKTEKLAGELQLPHGSGKKLRVEIATDKTLTKLNDNQIDFDVLIAPPAMMPKLAKYARILGPKGLMPNPKNGTISPDPAAAAKKFAGGLTRYKSEAKAPLLHLIIGKLSFTDAQLEANLNAALNTVKSKNIADAFLCTSMSPSVRLVI